MKRTKMKCVVSFCLVVVVSKRSLCPKKYVWGKKSVQNKEGKLGKCVSLEQTWKLSLNLSVVHSLMFAYVILCVSSFHVFNPSQNFDDRSHLSNIMIFPSIKLIITTTTKLFSSFRFFWIQFSSSVLRYIPPSALHSDSGLMSCFFRLPLSNMMRISALFITGAAALRVGRSAGLKLGLRHYSIIIWKINELVYMDTN